MNKIILGIIGQNGAGKTAVTEYLKKKYNAVSFRFSDPLKDILERLHLPDSRQNFQTLSTILRQNFSEDILSKIIAEDVRKVNDEIIITEGIRRPSDVVYLKELPDFHLIFLKADAEIRYERIKNRNEKSGDQSKTWKKFLLEENQESETQIRDIAKQADFTIDNNGSLKELYKQLDELVNKLNDGFPLSRE